MAERVAQGADPRPVVVVHGGAGNRLKDLPKALAGCSHAAEAGRAVLEQGGSALDAVEAAVRELEDDPIFNAGTGGALNERGLLELDASIMEGTAMRAGAVAALPPFRNPVTIARAALDDGRHVLYAGAGARQFAIDAGFEPSTIDEMRTGRSVRRLEEVMTGRNDGEQDRLDGFGTVGAVAFDAERRVAAATSTGGTVGQRPGRVGDTPLIGGGTYADDALGACSATGQGESIIRACLTYRTVMLLPSLPAQQAARAAIVTLKRTFGGPGGLILVDARGHVGIAKSTKAMSHAIARVGEETVTAS